MERLELPSHFRLIIIIIMAIFKITWLHRKYQTYHMNMSKQMCNPYRYKNWWHRDCRWSNLGSMHIRGWISLKYQHLCENIEKCPIKTTFISGFDRKDWIISKFWPEKKTNYKLLTWDKDNRPNDFKMSKAIALCHI